MVSCDVEKMLAPILRAPEAGEYVKQRPHTPADEARHLDVINQAERAAAMLKPILSRPETAAEHMKNALQILQGELEVFGSTDCLLRDSLLAIKARIEKALAQLEGL